MWVKLSVLVAVKPLLFDLSVSENVRLKTLAVSVRGNFMDNG
jgi:hypothetical protein